MASITSSFNLAMVNHPFISLKEFQHIIAEKNTTIDESDEGQYLTFNKVSPETFQKIETSRREGDTSIRFTYFADVEVLIVKVVTKLHEKVHRSLGMRIMIKSLSGMNMGFSQDDIDKGNFIFEGLSCKEDGSFEFKFFKLGDTEKFFVITGSGLGSFDFDVNKLFGEGVFTS